MRFVKNIVYKILVNSNKRSAKIYGTRVPNLNEENTIHGLNLFDEYVIKK